MTLEGLGDRESVRRVLMELIDARLRTDSQEDGDQTVLYDLSGGTGRRWMEGEVM